MKKLATLVVCLAISQAPRGRAGDLAAARGAEAKAALDSFKTDHSWQSLDRAATAARRIPQEREKQTWPNVRENKLVLLLEILKAADGATDPKFDPNDWPVRFVLPPAGWKPSRGYFNAVPPEDIKDPKLRIEYERAIAANEQKRAYHSQQSQFLVIRDSSMRYIRGYLKHAFSEKDRAEVERIVGKVLLESHLSISILEK
jgi:hypothetical protein